MLKIRILQADFMDLLKKMSLPMDVKGEFIFPKISPKVCVDGRLEWVASITNVTAYIRHKGLEVSGIEDSIRVPMDAKRFFEALESFKANDMITFIHDTVGGNDIFTNESETSNLVRTRKVPITLESEIPYMRETFQSKLDTDGVILMKGGTVKPDIMCVCDSGLFRELVENTRKIMSKSKKENKIPEIYNIEIDAEAKTLKTIAGNKFNRAHDELIDSFTTDKMAGKGEMHYSLCFFEIMNAYVGEIAIYAIDKGALWASQRTDKTSAQYLLPPAKVE